jgi:hypothetical protein
LGGAGVVLQAALGGGLSLVALPFGSDGLAPIMVDVGGRGVDQKYELASLDAALLSVEIYPNVPDLYRRKMAALTDLLTDDETRPETMEIIRSLIERIEVGPPEEECSPSTVTLICGLASVLSFVAAQGTGGDLAARAMQGGHPDHHGPARRVGSAKQSGRLVRDGRSVGEATASGGLFFLVAGA